MPKNLHASNSYCSKVVAVYSAAIPDDETEAVEDEAGEESDEEEESLEETAPVEGEAAPAGLHYL